MSEKDKRGLFDLRGKVALVTGGNSGLGLAYARGIAKCGGAIVLWGRRAAKNAEAVREISDYGVRVVSREVDVADEQAVIDGMRAAVDTMGRLDCVIANAGMIQVAESMLTLRTSDYKKLLATNLDGGFFTVREGARHMVERAKAGDPGGSIIISGSLANLGGVPGMVDYGASKGALAAIMKTATLEFGAFGIRANLLAIGFTETDLFAGVLPDDTVGKLHSAYAKDVPLRRMGAPEDLEGIAAYLTADCSSYHSGDIIVIDGGRSAVI
jgi:NAD(P)-dependent dehydrogenase (short-subunit alcohol dehydrogenase family)